MQCKKRLHGGFVCLFGFFRGRWVHVEIQRRALLMSAAVFAGRYARFLAECAVERADALKAAAEGNLLHSLVCERQSAHGGGYAQAFQVGVEAHANLVVANSEKILEVRQLATSFHTERGWQQAIDGVSFDVYQGEILGIVGESGCGKSVTSQSIMRLYDERRLVRYSGTVKLEGQSLLDIPFHKMQDIRGSRVSMIFQDALSSLNPVLTICDQISEPLRIHQHLSKKAAREKALEMLRLVGIPAPEKRLDQYPHELSGGMRQRVMIAIALACRPHLLIADEPTTALDVTIQAQIMELIVRLNEQLNMGVMLITHDLAVVAQTCSRVIVMYLGQIVEEADVLTLFDHPCHPYTEGLMRSIPRMEGDRTKPLYMIPGTVPLLSQIPTGCRFAPRCAYATERCRQETPQLTPVSDKQSVRCFRAAELAQKEATAQ